MLARIKHYNTAFFALCKKLLPKGRQKFFVLPVVAVFAVIGVLGVATPAHAIFTEILNAIMVAFSWIMFILARLFIGITIFALKFFIEVASYNNFIDTPTVKIGWFLVRDVANMFFVVLLLVIAFGTILGVEQYEWKKTMVKLVLAAVFINFSNMIAQLMIDAAHVFTITFVNAISATAGGNIIQLFNIDAVYKITGADKLAVGGDLKIEAFAASVASFLLALIMMVTMGAFAIVMAARMVILWVLIILSPLAYIFQVIPQTQKYAQEWWSEFTNHVIVAPVMVFFLWLAFATLNSSVPQLDFTSAGAEATSVINSGAQVVDAQKKLSISEATSWENLASFLIATVFLVVGLKVVRNLGVVAGGLTSSATGFAKKVATIATGYALGRAAYEKGSSLTGKALKGAAYHAPLIGGKKWEQKAKIIGNAMKGWYYGKGYELTPEGERIRQRATEKNKELADIEKKIAKTDNKEEKEKLKSERDEILDDLGTMERAIEKETTATKNPFGYFARQGLKLEKQLAKTEKQAEYRKKILWKRTGSEAGGKISVLGIPVRIGMGTKGFGVGKFRFFGERAEYDKEYEKLVYGEGGAAKDRVERGWYRGEDMRSEGKDEEFEGMGVLQALERARQKYDVNTNKIGYQLRKGSVMDQLMGHKVAASVYESRKSTLEAEAKQAVILGKKKTSTVGTGYQAYLEAQSDAKMRKDRLDSLESGLLEDQMSSIIQEDIILDQASGDVASGKFEDEAKQAEIKELEDAAKKKQSEIVDRVNKEQAQKKEVADIQAEIDKAKEEGNEEDIPEWEEMLAQAKAERDETIKSNTAALDGLRKDLKDFRVKLQKAQGSLAQDATSLRNGGIAGEQVAEDVIQKLTKKLSRTQETQERKKLSDEVKKWEAIKKSIQGGAGRAWQYAAQKGKAAESSRLYRYKHQYLLDEAEQRTVWDGRGIGTPNTALLELIEEFEKSFSQMSYDSFMSNAGNMFATMADKVANGQVTDQDRAAMAGLFKRGFNQSWMDDVIIAVMENDEARANIGSVLGWTNTDFSPDKIRDVEMLFASGGDVAFAKNNVVVSEMVDAGVNDQQLRNKFKEVYEKDMTVADVYEGMQGGWKEGMQGELQAAVNRHLQSIGRTFTEEQNDIFKDLTSAMGESMEKRAKVMNSYLETIRTNQATMQFMGNLRDQAIEKGHGENAGWALSHDVGGGEQLYIPSGVRMARAHVYGDANKTDVRLRAKAHTHMVSNLSETNGQVVTKVRERDYALMRNGIVDPRSWGTTNGRYIKHMSGFSASDSLHEFKDKAGFLKIGSSQNVVNEWSQNQKKGQFKRMTDKMRAKNHPNFNAARVQEALTAREILRNVYLPQMKANMTDFLLTNAGASGANQIKAISEGSMQLSIPVLDEQTGEVKNERIDNVEKLIALMQSSNKFGSYSNEAGGLSFIPQNLSDADRQALLDQDQE